MGGNDTDDDPPAVNMHADVDIDGDASGAAGGSGDNGQVSMPHQRQCLMLIRAFLPLKIFSRLFEIE